MKVWRWVFGAGFALILLVAVMMGRYSLYPAGVRPVVYRLDRFTGEVRFYLGVDGFVVCKPKAPETSEIDRLAIEAGLRLPPGFVPDKGAKPGWKPPAYAIPVEPSK